MGEWVYIPANFAPFLSSWQKHFFPFNCAISPVTVKRSRRAVSDNEPLSGKDRDWQKHGKNKYSRIPEQPTEHKQCVDQNRVYNHILFWSFCVPHMHSPWGNMFCPHDVSGQLHPLESLLYPFIMRFKRKCSPSHLLKSFAQKKKNQFICFLHLSHFYVIIECN